MQQRVDMSEREELSYKVGSIESRVKLSGVLGNGVRYLFAEHWDDDGKQRDCYAVLTPAHQAALAHNLAANLPRREQLELVLRLLGVEVAVGEVEVIRDVSVRRVIGYTTTPEGSYLEIAHLDRERWPGMRSFCYESFSLAYETKGLSEMAACCVRAMLDGEGLRDE